MTKGAELDAVLAAMTASYLETNRAAATLRDVLDDAGIGFWPAVDHLTIRTHDIDTRASQFVDLGYVYDITLEYEDWWAKVYRAPGYPSLFVDQAYAGEKGPTSLVPAWVDRFGDNVWHHIAIRVEDIDRAVAGLQKRGVSFAGDVLGAKGGDLRQIFSTPEIVDGAPFSVLELTERHRGYMGFSPPQANSLMRSTLSAITT